MLYNSVKKGHCLLDCKNLIATCDTPVPSSCVYSAQPIPVASVPFNEKAIQRSSAMDITRRSATVGGLSLLTGASMTAMSRAEVGSFLGIGEGLEDFWLATDAYIYGYPLVTMEMTRRVITNVAAPVGTRGADGPDHQAARVSERVVPGRDGAERRHALHDRVLRCRQGAVGAQHPRHEGPLLPDADAGRLDHRVPGARQAHHRHRGADLRDHRARAGRARCRPASRSTSRRPASCGCSAASIAPARRRTTPRSTSCRTSSSSCR